MCRPDPAELEFLRGMIQGMRCGVLSIDAQGRLLLVNEFARRILELADMPERGAPVEEALAMHPQLVRVLRESFSMSSLPSRAEIDLETGGGGKTIGFTLSLVHAEDGRPCGAAAFFKDLTQIEHKEEQDRLRDRLAALGQMAANLAHEIRNPLASIEVTCTLLKRRLGPDPAAAELLEKIVAEVRRLNASVNSSLEFVRPVRLELGQAELTPILEEAIAVAEGRRGHPGVVVRREFCRSLGPFLMDRDLLRQAFVNLVLNAMEAVGEQGTVTVSTGVVEASVEASVPYRPDGAPCRDPWHSAARFAVVRVADTGTGISKEEQERIFYPFFTTKERGSGVGLAVVKKIVGSHRGLIDVVSSPGKGAEFLVRLPMVLQAAEVCSA